MILMFPFWPGALLSLTNWQGIFGQVIKVALVNQCAPANSKQSRNNDKGTVRLTRRPIKSVLCMNIDKYQTSTVYNSQDSVTFHILPVRC